MGTAEQRGLRRRVAANITVDRKGIELAVLFAFVIVVTAMLAAQVSEAAASVSPPTQFGDGATGEAAAGAAWAGLEVVFAIVMLALIFVYQRLPEWAQSLAKYNAVIAILMYFGGSYQADGVLVEMMAIWMGLFSLYYVTDHAEIWWAINNAITVLLAIVGGVIVGSVFGVVGLALAMVGLTVYDHLFANKQSWMFTLGKGIMKLRLPVLFLRPNQLRCAWDDVVASMDKEADDDDEDQVGWGVGMADMLIPAGFVAAVVISPWGVVDSLHLVAIGAVMIGVVLACFRLSFEMETRGSGAGLPALSAGALVPYAALLAASALVGVV